MLTKIHDFFTPVLSGVDSFLDSTSNWVNAISLIISVITLITMLRFKRRIRVEFEKDAFRKKQNRIIKDLNGFTGSLLDDPATYVAEFLERIDIYLLELADSYTFLNRWLTLQLRYTSFCINHFYLKELANGNYRSRHKLCRQLRGILVRIRKE